MGRSDYPEEEDTMVFALARTKVLRARNFIAELEAEQADYVASKPVTITSLSHNSIEIRQAGITLLPGAIAADAIHNLRAALDLMASELARSNGESDENVYFPFGTDESHFNKQIGKKKFHLAGDDAVALIKTLRPYKGGNAALRALHDIDVQDKHRGLRLSASRYAIGRLGADGTIEFNENIEDFHFMFPETAGPFDGKRTIETLKELVQMVESILEAFAALITSRM